MTTSVNLPTLQKTLRTPDIFEVYFCKNPVGGNFGTRVFSKVNADYHRMYGYYGSIYHCIVRLGDYVYEVKEKGTISYPWTEALLEDERVVCVYIHDISKTKESKRLSAQFVLEKMCGRKLDIKGAMRYLWQSIGFFKFERDLEYMSIVATQDLSLPPSTFVKKRKPRYHLPFTCASLVNIVLYHLYGYEPGFTGHLAQSAALSLHCFAEAGYGVILDLVTGECLT